MFYNTHEAAVISNLRMEKPPDTQKHADTHATQLLQHELSSEFQTV